MSRNSHKRRLLLTSLVVFAFVALTAVTSANHSWNGYHWARQSNPFTVQVGDNVSGAWDSVLQTTASDWSQSTVLDMAIVAGGSSKRNCRPTSGRVEVCNDTYGNNGWLGIAQVWVSGSHITQGTVKLNDTYFNTPTYNTTAWRNLVSCQEVGHTLGLDHQDENFNNANLGTCMDYTNNPGTNQHPNKHDYDELVTIYSHLDNTTTVQQLVSRVQDFVHSVPAEWGKLIRHSANGKNSLFELDLGNGRKVFTFVIWS